MLTYRPIEPPTVPDGLDPGVKEYLDALRNHMVREGLALHRAAQANNSSVNNQILHAQPTRMSAGMEVYADGSDWNPGSGEGKYRRDKTNTSWTFIG